MSAVTAPWDERAVAAVAGPLRRVWSAVAIIPGVEDEVPLEADPNAASPTITHDEGWVPRVQSQLTLRCPAQDVLDLLDPRTGVRVGIDAGYVYPGGQRDVHRVAELLVSERAVRRPDNTMVLTLESDERLVMDNAPVFWDSDESAIVLASSTPCRSALAQLLNLALAYTPTIVYTPGLADDTLGADVTIAEGDSFWDALYDIADRIDAQVYHDGLGIWRIGPRPTVAGRSVAQLRVGAGGTITDAETVLARTDWANAVVVRYDTGNAIAVATSGPFSTAEVARKVMTVDRDAMPRTGGARAARALLKRAISRGRSITVSATDALWIRPGHTVTVQLPTGPQERHLVVSTRRELDTGRMHVTTRLPDDITITTGE